jgi:hypothetical protein
VFGQRDQAQVKPFRFPFGGFTRPGPGIFPGQGPFLEQMYGSRIPVQPAL